jgi:hypothetical protein
MNAKNIPTWNTVANVLKRADDVHRNAEICLKKRHNITVQINAGRFLHLFWQKIEFK